MWISLYCDSILIMKQLYLSLLVLFVFSKSFAQNDSTQIRELINDFFLALKTGDTNEMKKTVLPEISLATSFTARNGNPVLRAESFEEFLKSVGTPRKEEWNEQISNLTIHISDNLASVWMDYSFYLNSTFSHCGVNSFQLFKSTEGWKIISIVDTRRTKNCNSPEEK